MHLPRWIVLTLTCAVFLACDTHPSEPYGLGRTEVSVRAVQEGIRLTNMTDRPIGYTAFECDFAALVNWAPCVDLTRCPAVAPGVTVVIPYADIGGYVPGARKAIVFWWHVVGDGADDNRVEDVRSAIVEF